MFGHEKDDMGNLGYMASSLDITADPLHLQVFTLWFFLVTGKL
jgi:hypothetical protein